MNLEKDRKHIAIFSTAYHPFVGGAEVAVKEITDRVKGVEFDLYTARFKRSLPKREQMGNVVVHRIGVGIPVVDKFLLSWIGAFMLLSRSYKVYWVVMVSFAGGAAYIANILRFWKPTPIILHLQEGDSEEYLKTKWAGFLDLSWRLALRRTKFVAAISSYLLDRARRLGYKGEGEVIPIGVDVGYFGKDISWEERDRVRASWGFPLNAKVLITSSRLNAKNGVGDIISALVGLPLEICLVIAGTGELLAQLQKKVEDLKLGPRVRFVGYIDHEQLPALLKSADIFIRPSLSEGLGISFLEAMAARIPVIATLVGGIPDFLIDGKTGFACNPNDPSSIAEAVNRIVELDKEKLGEVIDAAYTTVSTNYNWDRIAQKMDSVFSGVLSKK